MRTARIKAEGAGYYHIMSKAIEGRFIFGPAEKRKFLEIMRKLEAFCGLHILTYSVLSNHWHILLEVPAPRPVSDRELIRRIGILYGRMTAREIYVQGRRKGTGADGQRLGAGFSAEQVKTVLESGGKLPRHALLRCRVRYFSDGLVLGGAEFVEEVFRRYRVPFLLESEVGSRPSISPSAVQRPFPQRPPSPHPAFSASHAQSARPGCSCFGTTNFGTTNEILRTEVCEAEKKNSRFVFR